MRPSPVRLNCPSLMLPAGKVVWVKHSAPCPPRKSKSLALEASASLQSLDSWSGALAASSPEARATAVSLFALSLFLGQSVGVLLASSLLERIGSSMVVALSGGALGAVGLLFARALSRRQAKLAAG